MFPAVCSKHCPAWSKQPRPTCLFLSAASHGFVPGCLHGRSRGQPDWNQPTTWIYHLASGVASSMLFLLERAFRLKRTAARFACSNNPGTNIQSHATSAHRIARHLTVAQEAPAAKSQCKLTQQGHRPGLLFSGPPHVPCKSFDMPQSKPPHVPCK